MDSRKIERARSTIVYGENNAKKHCIILMGLPGCGKSTVSRHLHDRYGYSILSWENITHALFWTEKCAPDEYSEAYSILHFLAHELILDWYCVVIDGTNLKRAFRTSYVNALADTQAHVVGIHLTVSDEEAFYRANTRWVDSSNPAYIQSACSRETFEKFKEIIELPSEDEGFVTIPSDQNLFYSLDALFSSSSLFSAL